MTEEYTGVEELDVMRLAKNYNYFLLSLVLKSAGEVKNLVDFGAGTGTFALELRQKGKFVTCIESDAGLRERLKSNDFVVFENFERIQDNSADFVYSLNVFEHIEDDQFVMNELYKRLKPGGRAFIYLPAFQVLYSSMDKKVGHYRRYNKKMLSKLVKDAGFKINDLRYTDSVGFFVSLLYKYIGNDIGDINPKALMIFDKFLFPINRVSDLVFGRFLGKNVFVEVIKKS